MVSEPGKDLHFLDMETSSLRFKEAIVERVTFKAPDYDPGASDIAGVTMIGEMASKSFSFEGSEGGEGLPVWLPPSPPMRLFPSNAASLDADLREPSRSAIEGEKDPSVERPGCQRSFSGPSTLFSDTQTSESHDLRQKPPLYYCAADENPQEAASFSSDSLAVRPLMVIKRTEPNNRKRTARDAGLSDGDSNSAGCENASVDGFDLSLAHQNQPHKLPDEEEQKQPPAPVEAVDDVFAGLDLEGLLERDFSATKPGDSPLNQKNGVQDKGESREDESVSSGCLGTCLGLFELFPLANLAAIDNDIPSDGHQSDTIDLPPSPSSSPREFVPWTLTPDVTEGAHAKGLNNEGDVSRENSSCKDGLDEIAFRQEGKQLYLSFREDAERALYKITITASTALVSDEEGWFYLAFSGLLTGSRGTSGDLVFDLPPETGMEFRTTGLYGEQMAERRFEAKFILTAWSQVALRLCNWNRYILRSFDVEQQIRHDILVKKTTKPDSKPLLTVTYNALFTVKPSDFYFVAERCSFTIRIDGGPSGDFVYELPESHEETDVIELSNPSANLIDACRVEIVCLPKQLGTFALRWTADFEEGIPSFWQPRIFPVNVFESEESVHLRRVLPRVGDLVKVDTISSAWDTVSEDGSEGEKFEYEYRYEDRLLDPEEPEIQESDVQEVEFEEQGEYVPSAVSSEMELDPPDDGSFFRWLLFPLDVIALFLEWHIRALGAVFRWPTVSQLTGLSVMLIGLYVKLAMEVCQLVDSTLSVTTNATESSAIKFVEPPVPVFMRAHSIRLDELYARRLMRDPYLEYICGDYEPPPPKRLAKAAKRWTATRTVTTSAARTRAFETDPPKCNCASFMSRNEAKRREGVDRASSKGRDEEKSRKRGRQDVFAPGLSFRDRVDYILGWEEPLENAPRLTV